MKTENQKNEQRVMFGCDPDEFLAQVKNSLTYKFNGAYMVATSLMSDAQEMIEMGFNEDARQILNRAKLVLFEMGGGKLIPVILREDD